ncbi:FadR/GntR family transcriptional regulator [Kytococcus sp. Marseille-QA3725]
MAGPHPHSPPPLRRERLHDRLASHITDFIEAQGLSAGDRLPSERQLAADLGVSRATLSRALAALESRGRIEVRHGIGALVRDPGGAPDTATLATTLTSSAPDEVVTAREAVLSGLARAAATHPSDSLRAAMLAGDGTRRTFTDTWRCLHHLAASELLADLDALLAASAPDPVDGPGTEAALEPLARAVVRGDPVEAATACIGLLGAADQPADPA